MQLAPRARRSATCRKSFMLGVVFCAPLVHNGYMERTHSMKGAHTMSAHSTSYMSNGHTLTVTEDTNGRTFHVIERDETGGLVHIYPCDSLAQANAMVEERAPAEVGPRGLPMASLADTARVIREVQEESTPTASERIRAARELVVDARVTRELRIVIDVESDEPELLGTFVENDAEFGVWYTTSDGRYKWAPEDCVRVVKVEL